MSNPKISVIIPVYNAEATLRRCVDSVLSQTFTDFECLLINDGSKDRSGEICDEYAAKDSRVRVFHKENGGVSSARNVGLDNMNGEWVTFVDSDDWIDHCYFQIVQSDIERGYQFIAHSCYPCDFNTQEFLPEFQCSNTTEVANILTERMSSLLFMTSWAKLFRSAIIRQLKLRFNIELTCCEDTLFNMSYLQNVENLSLRSNCIYHYSRGESNSLSSQNLTWDQIEYILSLLFNAAESLENTFGIGLTRFKIEQSFGKFVMYLYSIKDNKLRDITNDVKRLLCSRYVDFVINDSVVLHKGPRRHFVDYCIKYKFVFLLSLYIKHARFVY